MVSDTFAGVHPQRVDAQVGQAGAFGHVARQRFHVHGGAVGSARDAYRRQPHQACCALGLRATRMHAGGFGGADDRVLAQPTLRQQAPVRTGHGNAVDGGQGWAGTLHFLDRLENLQPFARRRPQRASISSALLQQRTLGARCAALGQHHGVALARGLKAHRRLAPEGLR